MDRLKDRVVFVTGAGSGIGKSSALRMAEEGAALMCVDIDEAGAQSTAAIIAERGGQSAAMRLDVSDEDALRAALEKTVTELGGLNVIMNNAGIGGRDWDETIAVNLSGVYYGLVHGAAMLAERGGGSIISTASIAGLVGLQSSATAVAPTSPVQTGGAAYIASKHGVVGLTRQFALLYAKRGVRVNAIAPGYIVTPLTSRIRDDDASRAFLENLHPMGRLGQPEEIGSVAAFLASDDASFITGVTLPVDGGYTAQ